MKKGKPPNDPRIVPGGAKATECHVEGKLHEYVVEFARTKKKHLWTMFTVKIAIDSTHATPRVKITPTVAYDPDDMPTEQEKLRICLCAQEYITSRANSLLDRREELIIEVPAGEVH